MAALDVVRKRLEDAGLGAFALELHSTAAPKRSVMDQLQRRMAMKSSGTPSRWEDRLAEACEKRDALNQYLRAVNAPFGNLGITLYEILWRLEQIRATSPVPAALAEVQLPNVAQLSTQQLAREHEQLQSLCRLHREVRESASGPLHPWEPFEELARFRDGHVQHFGDVLASEEDLERFAVVAFSVADFARHGHIREELHLDDFVAVARTLFAAPALHVEAEAPGFVAACA